MKKRALTLVCLLLLSPAALAAPDLEGFARAREAALDRLARAEARHREQAAAALEKLLSGFQLELARETERLEALLEHAARQGATDAERSERRRWEYARDRGELLLVDAHVRYARTIDDPAAREARRRIALRLVHGCAERAAPPLLYYAYLAEADLLVELGASAAALALYEDLCQQSSPDEDPSASTQDVLLRAYTGWAECLLAAGEPEASREVAGKLLEGDFAESNGRLSGSGRLRIALARADAACGQPGRAAKRLLGMIEFDVEPTALGLEARLACLALADTVDGQFVSAAAQFYSAIGFLLRGDRAGGTAALKAVFSQTRGRERPVWVPRAVGLLGGLLLEQRRHLEAALLYRLVLAEGELAAPGVGRALLAAQRAPGQFGEDPSGDGVVARICHRLRIDAARFTDPGLRARLLFQEAQELAGAEHWVEAAEAFAGVPNTSPLHAMARVRAGHCLLKHAQQTGTVKDLDAARVRLRDAEELARAAGEQEAWSLAALSLVRLANQAGEHGAALERVRAFAGPLRGTSRYGAARLEEALAHAELARAAALGQGRDDWLAAARALKEALLPKDEAGRAWAAEVFWRGGEYQRARALIEGATAPSDELLLIRALCDLGLGDHDEAEDGLRRLRQRVVLLDSGRVVARGELLRREERGPFELRYAGRVVRSLVWFDVVRVDDRERTFYELEGGRLVEGEDPTKPHDAVDVLALAWPFRDRFLLLEGMARATWTAWAITQSPRQLVSKVAPALNALLARLQRMSDDEYAAAVTHAGVEPQTRSAALWEAEVHWVELLDAREDWRGVRGHVRMMRLLGRWRQAPDWAKERLESLEAGAAKR